MKLKLVIVVFSIVCLSCNAKKYNTSNVIENKVSLAYKTNAQLGEGAIWNYKTKELYWVDIEGKSLNIYNPKTSTNRVLETPSRIGTVVPKNDGKVLVALEDGIYNINLHTGKSSLFLNMKEELIGRRLNDGKCDHLVGFG